MVIKPPSRPYHLDHEVFTSFGLRGPTPKFVLLASFRRVMALRYSIPRHSMVIVYLLHGWLMFMVNVGKHSMYRVLGICINESYHRDVSHALRLFWGTS